MTSTATEGPLLVLSRRSSVLMETDGYRPKAIIRYLLLYQLPAIAQKLALTIPTTERPLTRGEVAELRNRIKQKQDRWGQLRDIREDFSSIVGGLLTIAMVVFFLLAIVVKLTTGFSIATDTPYASEIVISLVVVGLSYALYLSVRINRSKPELVQDAQSDLESGIAVVRTLKLVDAKVFEEAEHGGLIYFLRTDDDRVYVAYDYESQELGAQGKNPMKSSFSPRNTFESVRGSVSGYVIAEKFSGAPLDVPDPLALTVRSSNWPEPDEFVDVPWEEVDDRYGS